MKITNLTARSIKDSRDKPTVEVELVSESVSVNASVPSGESAGSLEATVLPVLDALEVFNTKVVPALVGQSFDTSEDVDKLLLEIDGTENKSVLGGNTTLAVSVATTRAFAKEEDMPLWKYISDVYGFKSGLPRLYANVLEGGVHADWALPFQEHIVVPHDQSPSFASEQIGKCLELIEARLKDVFGEVPMGHEGGFAPRYTEYVEQPFELLDEIVGDSMDVAIDVAATEFSKDGMYEILGKQYSSEELLDVYQGVIKKFHLISVEDPFIEDDVSSFSKMVSRETATLVVGDDLTVTNPKVVQKMVSEKAANAIIIKPNQVGTVSEASETVRIAQNAGWKCIASHRGRETTDSFISDFAVAIGAFGVKVGSPTQQERIAKYDRLIEIEEEIRNL